MSDLERSELIEVMLDHYQNPHNYGAMEGATVSFQGGNPGCGDVVTMYLKLDGERIEQISFTGEGCTISQAAASMLTEELTGLSAGQVEALNFTFIGDLLGDEIVKMRPRCATVGLDAVKAALRNHRRRQDLDEAERKESG